MTSTAPTFSQIKAQVAAIRRKVANARVIGIHSTGRWSGEARKQEGNEIYEIEQCDSPLAMRIALRSDNNPSATKVLVTGLTEKDLSDDILLRLTKRRLFHLESWETVKTLFQAHAVDPRVARHHWIADLLMSGMPTEGYPPVSSGFLDAETVWSLLLQHGMGLQSEHPDLQVLLRWSIDTANVNRYRATSDDFREAAVAWLSELAGPAVKVVLDCVIENERPDALPIGLAVGVLFDTRAAGRVDKAIGKLEERYLGGASADQGAMRRWHAAASEVVRLQLTDPRQKRQQLHRADEILHEVGAESFAYLSDTSPLGFDLRLANFVERLTNTLESPRLQVVEHLTSARQLVLQHERANSENERRRLERLDMALRLVRWLAEVKTQGTEPQSLAEALSYEASEGSFVDWARLGLRSGDPIREVSAAYAKLFEQVTALREAQASRFALLLKDWTTAGSAGARVLGIEQILSEIVAPLVSQAPVLLVIVDGMSLSVCRELVTDMTQYDWVALSQEGQGLSLMTGLAMIPSVTEVSRTSLLCGQQRRGTAEDEKAGFAAHPDLVAHCRSGSPPVLFHKPTLREDNDAVLASEVREAIASSNRRVVGVVINAVDDHLLKGDQIDTQWTCDEIKVLPALLYEARTAKRLVVLVSDHGHVLDHYKTEGKLYDGGERWRLSTNIPGERELQMNGPRVLTPHGATLIAPWTEGLRYGVKKNGYHGGISPQEMVVPIVVLCAHDKYPDGWREAPVDTPAWWEESPPEQPAAEPASLEVRPVKQSQGLGPLFDFAQQAGQTDATPVTLTTSPAEGASEWITALFASPTLAEQKKLAGRAVPTDVVFRKCLQVLDRRGGKLTVAALARAMDYPPLRLPGLLAILQRILNVEGYPILIRDDAAETVELNCALLRRQFDLPEGS